MYMSLSITNMATPLSAVRTMWLSFFGEVVKGFSFFFGDVGHYWFRFVCELGKDVLNFGIVFSAVCFLQKGHFPLMSHKWWKIVDPFGAGNFPHWWVVCQSICRPKFPSGCLGLVSRRLWFLQQWVWLVFFFFNLIGLSGFSMYVYILGISFQIMTAVRSQISIICNVINDKLNIYQKANTR